MNKDIDVLLRNKKTIEQQEIELSAKAEEWTRIAGARKVRYARGFPLKRIHTGISLPDFDESSGPFFNSSPRFDYTTMADHIVNRMEQQNVAGYSYAIVQNGQLREAAGVGYTRTPSEQEPDGKLMYSNTRMVSASLAKPVCAVSIMKLVEEGHIQLNDKVGSFSMIPFLYPNIHDNVKNITIYQLLTHTSGLSSGGSLEDAFSNSVTPGTTEYSNKNYWLLGWVVADLTSPEAGVYGTLIYYARDNILAPMTITDMSNEVENDPCLYYGAGALTDGVSWGNFTSNVGPYGWYASVIDWAKFLTYFRYDKVISSMTRQQMLNDPNEFFGFRKWFDGRRGTYYGHGGDFFKDLNPDKGFRGGIMGFPDGVDAALIVNTWGGFDPESVLIDAYESAF